MTAKPETVAPDDTLVHVNPSAVRSCGDLLQTRTFDPRRFLAEVAERRTNVTIVRLQTGGAPEVLYTPENGAETLAAQERKAILARLQATGWRLAETARQLGISRTTLWRRLRTYGLTRDDDLL
jgi:transcriptional regulator of acetoin/glycerol metabolism